MRSFAAALKDTVAQAQTALLTRHHYERTGLGRENVAAAKERYLRMERDLVRRVWGMCERARRGADVGPEPRDG